MSINYADPIVLLLKVSKYDSEVIYNLLPNRLFAKIKPYDVVMIKPNWVLESHQYHHGEWDYVITHPTLITAVIKKVSEMLRGEGSIVIADAPTTEASFTSIINRYPVDQWEKITKQQGVSLTIVDLRDDEWETRNGIVVKRKTLPGDPKGKTEVNLLESNSEFYGHIKSKRGYYGADYDSFETNRAHDGHNNLYSVSRSALEADVFINMPKLKTHKKAGITSCLKNLVGINTYKNYLPHHSGGGPKEKGDQYPVDSIKTQVEGPLIGFIKHYFLKAQLAAYLISPLTSFGKTIFGDTRKTIRSGNWYGNDTLWRMVLDLNKILFYSNPDGTMKEDKYENRKQYIGIVDAVIAGEGDGPQAPEPVKMNYLLLGINPVAIDFVSARLMGFNPFKIPSIKNAFHIKNYPICNFSPDSIEVQIENDFYPACEIPYEYIVPFKPHFGWTGHVELDDVK